MASNASFFTGIKCRLLFSIQCRGVTYTLPPRLVAATEVSSSPSKTKKVCPPLTIQSAESDKQVVLTPCQQKENQCNQDKTQGLKLSFTLARSWMTAQYEAPYNRSSLPQV